MDVYNTYHACPLACLSGVQQFLRGAQEYLQLRTAVAVSAVAAAAAAYCMRDYL